MNLNLSDIEISKNVQIYQQISASSIASPNFNFPVTNIDGVPDFAIIRSIVVNGTSTGTTANNYVLVSDLSSDAIASFSGSFGTQNPQTLIKLGTKPIQSINFWVYQIATPSSSNNYNGLLAPTLPANWYINVSIDFIYMKKKHR